MVKEEDEYIDWKAQCSSSKSKEVLCLIKEYGLKTLVLCRRERECTALAGEISVLFTGINVKAVTQGLSKEEVQRAVTSFEESRDGILIATLDAASGLNLKAKGVGLAINTVLPSTAKEYYSLIKRLFPDQKLTAIVLWNYNDIIDGSDFIYDIAGSYTEEAPDSSLALKFIRANNRLYKKDSLCFEMIKFLNEEYGKKALYGIWTYKDTKELVDLLLKENKIKLCRWPFREKIGITLLQKQQPHLRHLPLPRPFWHHLF